MIVKCECNDCYLKDLCINKNLKLARLEGPEYLYVQLSCNHLHRGKKFQYFNCSKCINKPICKVFKDGDVEGYRYLDEIKSYSTTYCTNRLNKGAFEVIIECRGYTTK